MAENCMDSYCDSNYNPFVEKLCESMVEYFKYPFNTVTILEYNTTLTFPAVTICNYNDVRTSLMNGTLLDQAFKMKMKYGKEDQRYINLKNNITAKDMEYAAQAFIKPEHLIYDCLWRNSQPCTYKNFTQFTTVEGDTCYTINGENYHPVLTVDKTGLKNGLRLTLHSQMFDYYYDVKKAGFYIILHDQNETPFRMQGFSVSPGLVAFVELQLSKIKNLPPPYKTKCGDPTLKYFETYSRSKCFLDTLTQYVIEKCGCREWFMPDEDYPVCPTFKEFECLWSNWTYFEENKLFYEKCPVSCEITEYETAISYAMFPANSFADEWAQNERFPGKSVAERRKFLRDNFLEVVIYYEDLNYYLINQVPTYDTMNLLGDIGGQVGLFLGASSLTALEVLDFIFVLFRILYSKGNKEEKETEDNNQENIRLSETRV